jgi:hypothetical protein
MRPDVPYFIILLCLTPDDFTCQGESAATQWVIKTKFSSTNGPTMSLLGWGGFFGIPENTVFLKNWFFGFAKVQVRKKRKKTKNWEKNKIKMPVFQLIQAENL